MMQKVWCVFEGNYDGTELVAIFLDQESADTLVDIRMDTRSDSQMDNATEFWVEEREVQ